MTTNLQVGDYFPNFELQNHDDELVRLSRLTQLVFWISIMLHNIYGKRLKLMVKPFQVTLPS